MKKILSVIVVVLLVIGCRSLRVSTSSDNSKEYLSSNNSTDLFKKAVKVVDTTKTSNYTITITEVEFFNESISNNHLRDQLESTISTGKEPSVKQKGQKVKYIKTTTLNNTDSKNGKTENTKVEIDNNNEALTSTKDNDIIVQEKVAPDPYKWRYIFYTILLFVIIFAYLNRVEIIKKVRLLFQRKT